MAFRVASPTGLNSAFSGSTGVGGERAPGDHQMLLPHAGNEHWHRERIENSTHRESGDEESCDRCARLANREKEQCHVGEEPVDEDCFEEHGCEADLARGSAKMLRKLVITAARWKGAGGGVTTPRKAKNATMVTINPNEPRIANTPRQPNMSPITPAIDEPTTLPVRATASSRLMATWRSLTGTRSPVRAIATGNIPPVTSPAATRMARSSEKLIAIAQTSADSATTSKQTFISRVLPKKSPVTPNAGCTSA